MKDLKSAKESRKADLRTPSALSEEARINIAAEVNALLADTFAIYMKTKNFHWHMSGPHFRDFHLLLDEQSDQIFATTDAIAERVRKLGRTTIRSIGHIKKLQRLLDNDADFVTPEDMLAELREDNIQLAAYMRATHELCSESGDVATTSLLENWIDEAERRVWFLFESSRTR
ncbi:MULTISPECIES: Dps family protein [Pseudomonas]|jgi:starvation-inducible DNA-binding protein|uniref:DNA starvation/stationary phase protection protein n=1 Tax=Pseudomonas helleri TaxID=1608996 RepID=A0A6A7YLB0_9PSED|nr:MULTISPECIES: DNA starvation/stationary phase protection protein [Pseudomonas]MCU1754590.1 DNA starvation/stationary phase protection protein [Pseudomonas helleri]MQT33418.1 DNA starvation/stationary phase protection protein [Pseudomonas helleri]MQT41106.1 DNA starvation/stationary phase protection protein [Pseudomonas sp. FSL R10-0765]MQT49849.1 DNA starvation/stationary phase protection protein [Pseudomonas helleri]MQT54375.1 DNA starvation/stationary phase protection protein [Pseudomonas